MPLVRTRRVILGAVVPVRTGGTYEVVGDLDVSAGLVIELRSSIFNQTGIWTLVTWTGSLTGSIGNVTIDNQTGLTDSAPYVDGKSIKIQLS